MNPMSTRCRGVRAGLVRCGLALAVVGGWCGAGKAMAQPAAPAAAPTNAPAKSETRWYSVELMGKRAGWMRSTETVGPEAIITSEETVISIARGATSTRIRMSSTFLEAHDGTPISLRTIQDMGQQPVEQEYTFKDGVIVTTSVQQGRRTTKEEPRPKGEWLPPAAMHRKYMAHRAAGDKAFDLVTLQPGPIGVPIATTMTYSDIQPATLTLGGQETKVVKARVVTQLAGTKVSSTEYSDEAGELLRSETQFFAIPMIMSVCSKEEALKDAQGPEMLDSMIVVPDRRIDHARTTTKAVYVVSIENGELPALPTTGSQSVEALAPGRARVTIDTSFPGAIPDAELKTDFKAELATGTIVNAQDERVVALRDRALQGFSGSDEEKAERLRRAVHAHITRKNMSVGFATASEVVRTCEGDCTEHGVLLAALLRSAGIPSRAASGLIYADTLGAPGARGGFGYHMWTLALVERGGTKRWIDLDATLPDAMPYDATHIALVVSPLSDEEAAGVLMAIGPVLGRLSIRVESVK